MEEINKEQEYQETLERMLDLGERYKETTKESMFLNRKMLHEMKIQFLWDLLLMILWFGTGIIIGVNLR